MFRSLLRFYYNLKINKAYNSNFKVNGKSPKGVFVFEEPYLGSMFEKTSYDQIYDAHVFIFSLHSIKTIFKDYGFDLINCLPQKTHGGSMRYVIARKNIFKVRDIVKKIITKEKK